MTTDDDGDEADVLLYLGKILFMAQQDDVRGFVFQTMWTELS